MPLGFPLDAAIGPMVRLPTAGLVPVVMTAVSGLLLAVPMAFDPNPAWCFLGAIVHGAALSVFGMRLWTSTAHLAMTGAHRGERSDGLIFGSAIVTIHLASAAGMMLLGR